MWSLPDLDRLYDDSIARSLQSSSSSAQDNSSSIAGSTEGMLYTLYINLLLFALLMVFFEANRYIKQVYLSRCTKRFQENGRVPPKPQRFIMGWLVAITKLSEEDILNMAGLDAYMCMRYIAICMKASIVFSFWAFITLVPIYATASSDYTDWKKYTLANVFESAKTRLWAAVFFGYTFIGYFCYLFYIEYKNYALKASLKRTLQGDSDTPSQTNYSDPATEISISYKSFPVIVLVENIPPGLRSSNALHAFFEKIFPGEVYHVEMMLDLSLLEKQVSKRSLTRDRLEKAIAVQEATGIAPMTYVFKPTYEFYMYDIETVEAIPYYRNLLTELNQSVTDLQTLFKKKIENDAKEQLRSNRKLSDTRIAMAARHLAIQGEQVMKDIKDLNESVIAEIKSKDIKTVFADLPSALGLPSSSYSNGDSKHNKDSKSVGGGSSVASSSPSVKGRKSIFPFGEGRNHNQKSADSTPVDSGVHPDSHYEEEKHVQRSDESKEGSGPEGTIGKVENESKDYDDANANTNINDEGDEEEDEYAVVELEPNPRPDLTFHPDMYGRGLPVIPQTRAPTAPVSSRPRGMSVQEVRGLRDMELEMEREVMMAQRLRAKLADKGVEDLENLNRLSRRAGLSPLSEESDVENPLHQAGVVTAANSGEAHSDSAKVTGNGVGPVRRVFADGQQYFEINQINKFAKEKMSGLTKESINAARSAGKGMLKGVLEMEKHIELATLGAYFKNTSTAIVTFRTRSARSIAHQITLSHDEMRITPAPDPKDILWDNVSTPYTQVRVRHLVTNIALILGAMFWSSVVAVVYEISGVKTGRSDQTLNQYIAVLVLVSLLFSLPLIFDFIARYYEGFKQESDIQNSIMTRYFYYQLANVYVTITFGSLNGSQQIFKWISDPSLLVEVLGTSLPGVSLFFVNLLIVKTFLAIPGELLRPWPLAYILFVKTFYNKKSLTRRELRTGAFLDPPMLYGWIYPNIMMVMMIVSTYACIAPLLMPFGFVFFFFSYIMYKYQLLYVYINEYQSGGVMWHAVFSRSMIALIFAAVTLLVYLSLQLKNSYFAGPFYAMIPLPFFIGYFWLYCDNKFKKPSKALTLEFAVEMDRRNRELQAQGKPVPHDTFTLDLYRQPALRQGPVEPEPYVDLSFIRKTPTSAIQSNGV